LICLVFAAVMVAKTFFVLGFPLFCNMFTEHLKRIIGSLPDSPGIYKYYDADGVLMYIGKAKKLKKRVSSYFMKQHHENRKTVQ
jgi:ABC-type multidrug transport system ATPase subunit